MIGGRKSLIMPGLPIDIISCFLKRLLITRQKKIPQRNEGGFFKEYVCVILVL
jgi:hypothetical protein